MVGRSTGSSLHRVRVANNVTRVRIKVKVKVRVRVRG